MTCARYGFWSSLSRLPCNHHARRRALLEAELSIHAASPCDKRLSHLHRVSNSSRRLVQSAFTSNAFRRPLTEHSALLPQKSSVNLRFMSSRWTSSTQECCSTFPALQIWWSYDET